LCLAGGMMREKIESFSLKWWYDLFMQSIKS
jgi:hypothetical protein